MTHTGITTIATYIATYNVPLVVLSIVIASITSYTALNLAGRVTVAQGSARKLWLVGGAIAMGVGIWSMHFIAMLAYELPIPMTYDIPTVLISMVAAVLASVLALFVVSRQKMEWLQLLIGSIFMGLGIASMHRYLSEKKSIDLHGGKIGVKNEYAASAGIASRFNSLQCDDVRS